MIGCVIGRAQYDSVRIGQAGCMLLMVAKIKWTEAAELLVAYHLCMSARQHPRSSPQDFDSNGISCENPIAFDSFSD